MTFNLGNGKDIKEMPTVPGFTAEESEYINQFGIGEAIVSLKGRVRGPVHVSFPRVGATEDLLQDADIAARRD